MIALNMTVLRSRYASYIEVLGSPPSVLTMHREPHAGRQRDRERDASPAAPPPVHAFSLARSGWNDEVVANWSCTDESVFAFKAVRATEPITEATWSTATPVPQYAAPHNSNVHRQSQSDWNSR